MDIVKFNEKDQKTMKGLSKAIYIIARIFKVVSAIGIVVSILLFITTLIIIPNTEIDTKNQVVKIFDDEYSYTYTENRLTFDDDENEDLDLEFAYSTKEGFDRFANQSKLYQTSFVAVLSIGFMLLCFCLYKMLKFLDKLFKNIYDNDTPFNMDNVEFIKKIALYLALYVFVPTFIEILSSLIFNISLSIKFNMVNCLFIIIVLAISYVFKYGYEIQSNSKKKIDIK